MSDKLQFVVSLGKATHDKLKETLIKCLPTRGVGMNLARRFKAAASRSDD